MKHILFILLTAGFFSGCEKQSGIRMISSAGKSAESVYLTQDQNNNPVVTWTERDGRNLILYFATSADHGKSFAEKRSVLLSDDVATHAEGMPKVAFKNNGDIVVAYEKKAPTPQNKYAGSIYYRMSQDQGKSWTTETFLHSDTIAGRSRSYFDIERLPDGEIGAAWLDLKLDQETGGRSVRFAKTSPDHGFANEILVDSSACQCCRMDVYTDITGKINIAYRGLMNGKMGESIRDMMLAVSDNNGADFSKPKRIAADNWVIDGCPHTGPSLCSTKAGLFSLSYTEGNGTGIYYNFRTNADSSFTQRELVSGSGHHPQASANESRFMMVWEENETVNGKRLTRILYQTSEGDHVKKEYLTPQDSNAFLPVVTQTTDGFLVAFQMDSGEGVGVFTIRL